jgi:chemotaxis-related protein WspD
MKPTEKDTAGTRESNPAAGGVPQAGLETPTDCWNRIGVSGDASCPELDKFVQCHHCPVYARAGQRLLDRALPAGYRHEWTTYFAEYRKPAAANRTSVLIFRVDDEWLALPTPAVQEIAEHRAIHGLPHRRHGVVLGLVNIRGELLPCVSLGRVLGLTHGVSLDKLRTFYDRLLVAVWEGKRLVFPAHEMRGIHRFAPEDLTQPPTTITKAAFTFTRGLITWQNTLVGLLEPELLFSTLNRSLT